MIVLSEASPQVPDSPSLRDLNRSTEAARLAGWKVYYIPQDLPESVSADAALWHIPMQDTVIPAIWVGFIPFPEHYAEIYGAALARNIQLVNSPDQFQTAEEFTRFYPLIADLTAESRFASTPVECEAAAAALGYPVFLKGSIQSLKAEGIGSCVAHSAEEVRRISHALLRSQRRTLGKVVIRQFLKMRHSRTGPGGFPLGREFRVFVYQGCVVGFGYYWEGDDPLESVSPRERATIEQLAVEAAKRLNVPYLAVDVGQKEDGDWIVIEVGDGQFSGLSKVPIHEFWACLTEEVERGWQYFQSERRSGS